MLVRYQCKEWNSHDHVMVNLSGFCSRQTILSKVSVPCPDCGRKTRPEVVG